MIKRLFSAIFIFLISFLFFIQFSCKRDSSITTTTVSNVSMPIEHEIITPDNGIIKIDKNSIKTKIAKYYVYKSETKDIKFFVLKIDDNEYKTSLDACNNCYPGKKGFRQAGNSMICNICGQAFTLEEVNNVEGGCSPIPLKSSIKDEIIEIDVNDLISQEKFF